MTKRSTLVATALFIVYLALGALGIMIVEPGTGFGRAIRWALVVMTTLGPDSTPTSEPSAWFQSFFSLLSFGAVSLALSTVIIPPILTWWEARINGRGAVSRWDCLGRKLFLVVGPVDWEKAESLVNEMTRQNLGGSFVVVVSDDEEFPDIPSQLAKSGVGFVKGNLRDPETFRRAGLASATGAFICASSYDKPEQDAKAAAIVAVIEGLRPEIITIAEQVCRESDDLFSGQGFSVDATVAFDPQTLGVVARRVSNIAGGTRVSVEFNAIDAAQQGELDTQLAEVGLVDCGDGNVIRIILPGTLDDTSADYDVWAALQRAEAAGELAVALFLSVKSEGLFASNPNALCADRIMADALVSAMREKLDR